MFTPANRPGDPPRSVPGPASVSDRPAAIAAIRVSRAGLLLGGLGLASAIFLVARLFESWRVTSRAASHQISIFGQPLSYPTANADAIVVVLLSALGSVVIVRALSGAVRELVASRRFHRRLAREHPRPLRGALLIDDAHPRAFCAGLLRPRVYLTTGALTMLDDGPLSAVLAHERHHALRHDPLRLAAGRVLARALFFLPQLGELVEHQQALAELSADESAVNAAPANRSALARAMLSFSDTPASAGPTGIDRSRVDYLLGEPPSWRFPALLCVAAATVIALLTTVAVLGWAARQRLGHARAPVPLSSALRRRPGRDSYCARDHRDYLPSPGPAAIGADGVPPLRAWLTELQRARRITRFNVRRCCCQRQPARRIPGSPRELV